LNDTAKVSNQLAKEPARGIVLFVFP